MTDGRKERRAVPRVRTFRSKLPRGRKVNLAQNLARSGSAVAVYLTHEFARHKKFVITPDDKVAASGVGHGRHSKDEDAQHERWQRSATWKGPANYGP